MEMSVYAVELLARDRIADLRAAAARRRAAHAPAAVPVVTIRTAAHGDNADIAGIWNYEAQCTAATTETEPRTLAAQSAWLACHGDRHPVIVATSGGDGIVGFGALSPYRSPRAFQAAVEDSVYVRRDRRGCGVGAALLGRLLDLAREREYRTVLARITAGNTASLRLHVHHGFRVVGVERQVAFKLGRWHDVVIVQRLWRR
ncbi:MAG TPA: GNAT family N-acetyltransferase [Methylomirabilota bacterium]